MPSKLRSQQAPRRPRWRCSTTTKSALSADELAAADATARVAHCLSQGDLSLVGTFELLAFCGVKGLGVVANFWDRAALEAAVRNYARLERLTRIRKGDEWEAMPTTRKVRALHDVCNAEGDVTYIDPETGYTVFSYFAHLKRGNCCGIKARDEEGEDGKRYERTHRCRHCPYTELGELKSVKMQALRDRVAVIEYARERAQQVWAEASGTGTGVSFGTLEEQESATLGDTSVGVVSSVSRSKGDAAALERRFAKVARIEKPKDGPCSCADCGDEQVVMCTRCKGWTHLFSPQLMKCPQCEAKGFHPCMNCTPFRPPSRSSFYS